MSGRLPGTIIVLCGEFLADELDDLRNQFGGHDHDGLPLGQKGGFVFGNLFVFGLVVVVLGKLADSLFVPSGGVRPVSFSWSFLFPPLASAKRSLRLGRQVEGGDNECTVANGIRHVNNLEISSRLRLTETNPRTISARDFFSCPTQDLAHFFLGDAMIENVWQIGFWINPETQLHSVVLSALRLSSLLRIEPS